MRSCSDTLKKELASVYIVLYDIQIANIAVSQSYTGATTVYKMVKTCPKCGTVVEDTITALA